jgi:GNAT superfamily N-acetyltransferase
MAHAGDEPNRDYDIAGQHYVYCREVRDHEPIRQSFNEQVRRVFGFSFEAWYRAGYWLDAYEPHVLLDHGRVVANVSVNKLTFWLDGRWLRLVQIGTVLTDPDYRGRGLARFLMDKVLAEYEPHSDGIYLYANDSVTGFYPRFGFTAVPEYECWLPLGDYEAGTGGPGAVKRLNMGVADDVAILLRLFRQGNPFSRLSLVDNEGLLIFYGSQALRESVYYLPDCQAAVIAGYEGGAWVCYDVFGGEGADLRAILRSTGRADPGGAADRPVRQARLGFSPRLPEGERLPTVLRQEHDTTLFWLSTKPCPLQADRLMFPLLSHA